MNIHIGMGLLTCCHLILEISNKIHWDFHWLGKSTHLRDINNEAVLTLST